MRPLRVCIALVLIGLRSTLQLPTAQGLANPAGATAFSSLVSPEEPVSTPDPLARANILVSRVAKLTASDPHENSSFGWAVAVSGDTAVVGAPAVYSEYGPSGAVYIYRRNQGGPSAWGQVMKITPVDTDQVEYFGHSVSLDGDILVVGAPSTTVAGHDGQGAVYIFSRDLGGSEAWGQVKKLIISDGGPEEYFGSAVSLDEDTLVVGAPAIFYGGSDTPGSAYIFYRDQGGQDNWGQINRLAASESGGDAFGSSVSIDQDTLGVGAPEYQPPEGAVFVYERDRNGADNWGRTARLIGVQYEGVGRSVSINADTLVTVDRVYERNQGGADAWGLLTRLRSVDYDSDDEFGASVSIAGEMILVGAPSADVGSHVTGNASLFLRRGESYPQGAGLFASEGAEFDDFGASVAFDGETIVIGAPSADLTPHGDQGAAYVFAASAGSWFHFAFLPGILRNYCSDYFDDFSNPASGWPVGEDEYVKTEYLDGEYRVDPKKSNYIYFFRAPTCNRLNYSVEVDARWEGDPGASYGLLFGITGNFDQFYLFDMNTDYREYELVRLTPSGWAFIAPPAYSPAIIPGSAVNHLKVTRNGNQITLAVNGNTLGTWLDSAIGGMTGVGLVANPYNDDPRADARFDNYHVNLLPGVGLQSGAPGTSSAWQSLESWRLLPAHSSWR